MESSVGFTHHLDQDGILHVVFDFPGQKVNLFNATILEALGQLMTDARRREEVRAVLIGSAKPRVFMAGMDLDQIASVTDAYQASEGARFGQSVFQHIADLEKPSACAIGGVCMGGGTEMALACNYRVASDDPSVRIALPEVQLGIIPGFGGSQRMPRLVGVRAALDAILTGKSYSGEQAKKIGLVDRVVPQPYLERETLALLRKAIQSGNAGVERELGRKLHLVDRLVANFGPLRSYVLDQARKRTEKRVAPKDYPAPFRAIEAIEASMTQSLKQGLDLEARILGELAPTPTSKNLIWLFKSQTALKGDTSALHAPPRRVKRCAVVGAGVMGGGIARLAADRNVPVRLKDIRYDSILTALRTAREVWDFKLKRKRMTQRELDQKMALIAPTLDQTGLVHADLVIEAVVENLDIKQRVLADVEQRLDPRAVFATNTSSIPIGDIAARARHPERVVGLHFFNPVHRMPLVEIIAGKQSSPEAVATVHTFARRLGKVPVVVKDAPGFLVNRILTLYLNEAMALLSEGNPIDSIDQAMTAFGMPMGPFALLDQIGLDTAQHVGEVLQNAFGQRIGGDDTVVRTLVAAGRLGLKNDKGFYRYKNGKSTVPDTEIPRLLGIGADKDLPPETLQERMVLAMLNEAAVCLQERVARDPRDLDMSLVLGTGFPPFRGGLLRHADAVGIPIIVDRLSRLADAHGERFRPAELMQQMVREQRRFYT